MKTLYPRHTTIKLAILNAFHIHPEAAIRPLDEHDIYDIIIKQDLHSFGTSLTPARTVGSTMYTMFKDFTLVRVKGIGGRYVYTRIETSDLLELHTKINRNFAIIIDRPKTLTGAILHVLTISSQALSIKQIFDTINNYNGYNFTGETPQGSVSGTVTLMYQDGTDGLLRTKINGIFHYTLKTNKVAVEKMNPPLEPLPLLVEEPLPMNVIHNGYVYTLSHKCGV